MRLICEVHTTVNLDPDTAATVDAPRRDKGLGLGAQSINSSGGAFSAGIRTNNGTTAKS